jgi:phosphoribosyl 1,2-cyclic phosphate phosphodiesterase
VIPGYNVPMSPTRSFTFLGTGTSTGVPMLGCECAVCKSTDPRNRRDRCAALVRTPNGNLLIDTPPELRHELLRNGNPPIHSVLYTHYHADHLFGLDDLRQLPRVIGGPVPVYCTDDTEAVIRTTFPYVFDNNQAETPASFVPRLEFRRIKPAESFTVLGQRVLPVPLIHAQFRVLGFRIGDLAYCTDVNRIPEASMPLLRDLRVLILDALRYRPHPAHFGLQESLDMIAQLKPDRSYLTHLSHEFDHETVSRELPANVELAYDGLTFDF